MSYRPAHKTGVNSNVVKLERLPSIAARHRGADVATMTVQRTRALVVRWTVESSMAVTQKGCVTDGVRFGQWRLTGTA
jgi:hypothetical protein